jgi:hypothetical protein
VFGNKKSILSIKTSVVSPGKGHRNVAKWGQIIIEEDMGFENSISSLIEKCDQNFVDNYFMFLPAMMKNNSHKIVARKAHEYDDKILVISVNQYGVVGRIAGSGDESESVTEEDVVDSLIDGISNIDVNDSDELEFKVVKHKTKFKNESLAVRISDIISKTNATKVIVTGFISLCRGVTIQAKREELINVGINVDNPLLKGGLVMNCVGVHEKVRANKLGNNSDLIQRLCRGNGYPDPLYTDTREPKLIGCERIIKAFTGECEFIEICMDEGRKTGVTTDVNFRRVKEMLLNKSTHKLAKCDTIDGIESRFRKWSENERSTKISDLLYSMDPNKIYTKRQFKSEVRNSGFQNSSSVICDMNRSAVKVRGMSQGYGYLLEVNRVTKTIRIRRDLVKIFTEYFGN